jgi:hypothetical protein
VRGAMPVRSNEETNVYVDRTHNVSNIELESVILCDCIQYTINFTTLKTIWCVNISYNITYHTRNIACLLESMNYSVAVYIGTQQKTRWRISSRFSASPLLLIPPSDLSTTPALQPHFANALLNGRSRICHRLQQS